MKKTLKKCWLCGKLRRFTHDHQPSCDDCGGGVRVDLELDARTGAVIDWEVKP